MTAVNARAKQEMVGFRRSPAADRAWQALGTTRHLRAARIASVATIDTDNHLWFAVAVSLVLHGLLLTAFVVKSRRTPVYHPVMYGMGTGLSVVHFVSGTLDGSGEGDGVMAPRSSPVEVAENPAPKSTPLLEATTSETSVIEEAEPAPDSVNEMLQPEPITDGAAAGEQSDIGSVAGGTIPDGLDGRGNSDSSGNSGAVKSGGGGSGYGVPAYLHNPSPPYPRVAREHGWEGTTLLQVEVFDDGTSGKIEVLKSSGYDVLDEAVVTTVRRWRFLPARSGDTPIRSLVEIPIRFRLAGK